MYVAYVSSEENIKNLETIRQNNLKNAGVLDGNSSSNDIAIVWLSYNVHGNEASSTEASMNTLYKLLTEKQDWLKNTVVIIDPCIKCKEQSNIKFLHGCIFSCECKSKDINEKRIN